MVWLDYLSWAWAAFLAALGGFAITALRERERRAAAIAALGLAGCGGLSAGLILLGYRHQLALGMLGLLLASSALLLPLGRHKELRIVGEQEQVDERDIIFARARYRPGSAEYQDYYTRHPELKEVDDRWRALPELGAPGGQYYDELLTPLANATFELLQEVGHLVEGPVAPVQLELKCNPAEMAEHLKRLARRLGADLVGIAELDRAYVYSHVGRGPGSYGEEIVLDHEYAIVIGVEMDWWQVRAAPAAPTLVESAFEYLEAAKIALTLAKYIRALGYPARAHIDANYRVLVVPLAWKAGLGELGRMGYLITPQFGPRVRFSVVTTDLSLETDEPIAFGVQDFCERCKKCAHNCPARAIPEGGKRIVHGVEKWELDRERCYAYWRALGTDCAICMRVCPYSHSRGFPHNLVRWAIKRSVVARQLAVWLDDLFYGRRPRGISP